MPTPDPVSLSPTFTIVDDEDWIGIYLDGQLLTDGSPPNWRDLVEALAARSGGRVTKVETPGLFAMDGMPDDLIEAMGA